MAMYDRPGPPCFHFCVASGPCGSKLSGILAWECIAKQRNIRPNNHTQPTSPRYSMTSNYCSHRHRRALSQIDAQPLHLRDQGRPRQTQPSSSAIPATDYTFRLLESLKDVRTLRLFQSDKRG